MSDSAIGFWLLVVTQIALLVIHYGSVVQNLPWWLVWSPILITGAFAGVILLVFVGVIVIAVVTD